MLVFRNQRLGPTELAAFGAQFGRPQPHILEQYRHPDRVDVSYITNVDKNGGVDRFGVIRASTWHTDETYEDALPRLAILHALEVPSTKGGTMFADMRAAYDALPETTRRRLDGLVGLHGRTNGPDAIKLYGKAYVDQHPNATADEIFGALTGLLCRCHAHTRMVKALVRYAQGVRA